MEIDKTTTAIDSKILFEEQGGSWRSVKGEDAETIRTSIEGIKLGCQGVDIMVSKDWGNRRTKNMPEIHIKRLPSEMVRCAFLETHYGVLGDPLIRRLARRRSGYWTRSREGGGVYQVRSRC